MRPSQIFIRYANFDAIIFCIPANTLILISRKLDFSKNGHVNLKLEYQK